METKANYVLIGVFTLAVVVGVFGFVYWFQNIGGTGERAFYRVVFDGSVSGLRTGGSVLYNGIRVGEVTGLKLDPEKPQQVTATLSIDKSVAVPLRSKGPPTSAVPESVMRLSQKRGQARSLRKATSTPRRAGVAAEPAAFARRAAPSRAARAAQTAALGPSR